MECSFGTSKTVFYQINNSIQVNTINCKNTYLNESIFIHITHPPWFAQDGQLSNKTSCVK